MYGPSLTPYKGYTGSITIDFENKLKDFSREARAKIETLSIDR